MAFVYNHHNGMSVLEIQKLIHLNFNALGTLPESFTETWPLAPKFAGSNLAEAIGFFGHKNPQHAFLRRGSKRICPMSQLCGM